MRGTFKTRATDKSYIKATKLLTSMLLSVLVIASLVYGSFHFLKYYVATFTIDGVWVQDGYTGEYLNGFKYTSETMKIVIFPRGGDLIICLSKPLIYEPIMVTSESGDDSISVTADPTIVSGDAFGLPYEEEGDAEQTHDFKAVTDSFDRWRHRLILRRQQQVS